MALYFTSINSGSNGNCYYVGNEEEAILVDVGLPCKEVEKRMLRLGLSIQKVKAVFISHEHSDHIKGLAVFARKYKIPVYISVATLKSSKLALDEQNTFGLSHTQNIQIGKLQITAFSKFHDAADPYSFTIECNEVRVGVFTDIGSVCDRLINQFKRCHAAFLESNYCANMLANGQYPYFLKRRITSGRGHLSNSQALDLFLNHRPDYMSHLLLSHLSKDNNNPVLVEQMFNDVAGNTIIKVASRDCETEVYYVSNQNSKPYRFDPSLYQPEQLNLF
ncbi:phosphoribosyl 1,2-cyclic phosphodiesterase [Pedobacter psychrotolerans]|uniref:MBL fold metallo-hydrolase n=1 Tax=Pedobacter psychrotolerans TaxID=1843235 RepID=A0A4R2H3G2_9SPHI|nr:MBL fold metallo-hydrolase [Pedobacter psychrotolerans]TCO19820.1 phosphoribosyl 1,2-cyclic phosphodiesterase [Pedobacter psychrotolerans]GGE49129.1 MBL fold metallo-hydrolase [Pedobacter psychrotolerans]